MIHHSNGQELQEPEKNGSRLASEMSELGLSQRELGRLVGISHTKVGRLIRGEALIEEELWTFLREEREALRHRDSRVAAPLLRDRRRKKEG